MRVIVFDELANDVQCRAVAQQELRPPGDRLGSVQRLTGVAYPISSGSSHQAAPPLWLSGSFALSEIVLVHRSDQRERPIQFRVAARTKRPRRCGSAGASPSRISFWFSTATNGSGLFNFERQLAPSGLAAICGGRCWRSCLLGRVRGRRGRSRRRP
ncbi:hypothetical protein Pan258_20340 [Symmachiella dynata]|nr:hypothetical protein Pan258_20340 [Symmachiella dynata]